MELNDKYFRQTYSKYLITSMLAILGSVLGQTVNNAIVGNVLGVYGLSVTGITLPIHYVFATLGALLGIGGMTVCAILIGKRQKQMIKETFTVIYILNVVTAVAVAALMLIFLNDIVKLLGTQANQFTDVKKYAFVMIISGIFTIGIYPAFHILRLDGKTWTAVIVFIVMAVVTILLDIICIIILKMGILGAAIAYGGGSAAASIFGAVVLFFRSEVFKLVKIKKDFLKKTKEIVKVGSPSAIENLCLLLKVLVLNLIIMSSYGVTALSAYNITNTLLSFAFIFVSGVSGSVIPFVGVLNTERDIASIKQLLRLAFLRGVAIITAFSSFCILFASYLSKLFGMSNPDELKISVPAISIIALSFIPMTINYILICHYQGTNKSSIANVLMSLRGFIFTAAFAALFSKIFGVVSVWHSIWISEILTLAVNLVWALVKKRKNPLLSFPLLLDTRIEKEGKYIAFSVPDKKMLGDISEKISEFCETNDIAIKRTAAISLAIEEIVMLLFEKNSKNPNVAIRIFIMQGVIVLRIRDTGKLYNPFQAEVDMDYEDANNAAEDVDVDVDTLGIKLVKAMAETVIYQQNFGSNTLTIFI